MSKNPPGVSAPSAVTGLPAEARYTWGGEEFLFIEIDEAMSLAANFKATSLANRLLEDRPAGVIDVCPANASLLIRFNPDELPASTLEKIVRGHESAIAHSSSPTLETRIIEVPVWYEDPFTAEVESRFRDGFHQEPQGSDLEYAAKVNGLKDVAAFIKQHHEQPWLVSMVGFVAGLPFLFQLVEQEKQLQVPKYLSPRTDTPKLTVAHGGCFGSIYSVRGAGGYQMLGIAAAPIFEPTQSLEDFKNFMVFFRPGDIVKYRPIDEKEYNRIQAQVEAGTFRYRIAPVTFDLRLALEDPQQNNAKLMEALNGS